MANLPRLLPGAEPQFYRGNEIGCLVLHGFMAAPSEVKWLAAYLAQTHGYTVYAPRLTGHGVDPTHMLRMRWQDWYAQALDGYHLLRAQCEQVYVIGHSMGGLLALRLAAALPVAGVIVAGAPLTIPNRLMYISLPLSLILRYTFHPPGEPLESQIIAEQTRRGEPAIGRTHYRYWASRAVYELYQLIQTAPPYVAQIRVPLLLVYAEFDDTVNWGDHILLRHHARGTEWIEEHILKAGAHVIFQDVARAEAFQTVGDFIQRVQKAAMSHE
jgi:carboxylesterase